MVQYPEQEKKHNAGVELDKLARRFMAENNVNDYSAAMKYVLAENPQLERRYSGDDSVEMQYVAQKRPAAAQIDKMTQLKMLRHNLPYPEAQKLVFGDPDNAELVSRYVKEARNRV